MPLKIYLAGPDVFLRDAREIGQAKQALCRDHGFVGLFPLDNEIEGSSGASLSRAIFHANVAMIREADMVIANLTPLRGVSLDVGTAFEIGFGFALGKPIHAYSNVPGTYADRVARFYARDSIRDQEQQLFAADGLRVEDHGLVDNLMIVDAVRERGGVVVIPSEAPGDRWRNLATFEECLSRVKACYTPVGQPPPSPSA